MTDLGEFALVGREALYEECSVSSATQIRSICIKLARFFYTIKVNLTRTVISKSMTVKN